MNEHETARAIASGELPSPTKFGNFSFVALRVTGTGTARREALNESVFRDSGVWLNDATLERLNGLPVVVEHPEKKTLDDKEYANRSVGAITFPYIAGRDGFADPAGEDVWGISRIYDEAVIKAMVENRISTSPGVAFRKSDGNVTVPLQDGSHLLVEGDPSLIDHLAICEAGVWDKGAEPSGVRIDNVSTETKMTEENMAADGKARKDAEEKARKDADAGTKLDKVLEGLGSINARLDALESGRKNDSRKDEDGPEAARRAAEEGEPRHANDAEKRESEAADRNAIADEQARVDSVYRSLGQQAPFPMAGETVQAYRVRSHRGIQSHSQKWKNVELHKLPVDAMNTVLNDIRNDAMEYARAPNDIAPGQLRMVTKVDPVTGQRMNEFFGTTTFIGQMKRPSRRVSKINTKFE